MFAVIVPVFALVALGALLRGRLGLGDGAELGRLLYWVALPAQLLYLTSRTDLAHGFPWLAVLVIGVVVGVGISVMLWLTRGLDAPARGSLANGAMRPNGAFIGLPIIQLTAMQLEAATGSALVGAYALVLGPGVIVFNLAAVVAFRWSHPGGGVVGAVADLPRNPILVSCAIGTAMSLWRPGLFEGTIPGTVLAMLASSAIPLALITAGLGLDLRAMRDHLEWMGVATVAKLVIQPAAAWGLCRWCGLDPVLTAAVTVLMASPAAMAAVPMARALGGDPALMAGLVTVTTLLAPLSLGGWLWFVCQPF